MTLAAFLAAVVGHYGGIPFTVMSPMPLLSEIGVFITLAAILDEDEFEVIIC